MAIKFVRHFWPNVQHSSSVPYNPNPNRNSIPNDDPTNHTLLDLTLFERLAKNFDHKIQYFAVNEWDESKMRFFSRDEFYGGAARTARLQCCWCCCGDRMCRRDAMNDAWWDINYCCDDHSLATSPPVDGRRVNTTQRRGVNIQHNATAVLLALSQLRRRRQHTSSLPRRRQRRLLGSGCCWRSLLLSLACRVMWHVRCKSRAWNCLLVLLSMVSWRLCAVSRTTLRQITAPRSAISSICCPPAVWTIFSRNRA